MVSETANAAACGISRSVQDLQASHSDDLEYTARGTLLQHAHDVLAGTVIKNARSELRVRLLSRPSFHGRRLIDLTIPPGSPDQLIAILGEALRLEREEGLA